MSYVQKRIKYGKLHSQCHFKDVRFFNVITWCTQNEVSYTCKVCLFWVVWPDEFTLTRCLFTDLGATILYLNPCILWDTESYTVKDVNLNELYGNHLVYTTFYGVVLNDSKVQRRKNLVCQQFKTGLTKFRQHDWRPLSQVQKKNS